MYIPSPYFKGIPQMGNLEMDNIFLENGYPVLFTCRNKDKIYLCICRTLVEEQKWVITEITFDILKKLIENKVSIYDAFKNSGGCFCIARWKKSTQCEEYDVSMSGNISDEDLPDQKVFLDDDGDSAEYLEKVKNRIDRFATAKLDACFEGEQDKQIQMAHISIKESCGFFQDEISDINFSICSIKSSVKINSSNVNYDFIVADKRENRPNHETNRNLAA